MTGGGNGGSGAATTIGATTVTGEDSVVLEDSSNELIELENGTESLGVGTGTNEGSKSGRMD